MVAHGERPVRTFDYIPNAEEIRAAVLGTSLRPAGGEPTIVWARGGKVVLNIHGLLRGLDAAAVFYEPPRPVPARVAARTGPRLGALVVVAAAVRLVGRRRKVEWLQGMVGEVACEPPPEWFI